VSRGGGGLRAVAFIANSATARAGILAGLSHDRILASWWFGVRLAEGCEGGLLSVPRSNPGKLCGIVENQGIVIINLGLVYRF